MKLVLYGDGRFVTQALSSAERPPAVVIHEGVEYWIVSIVGKVAALYECLSAGTRLSDLYRAQPFDDAFSRPEV